MSKIESMFDAKTETLIAHKNRVFEDVETGELLDVHQILKVQYGSKAFWKCYLADFLAILGIFESKQLDILIHILENTNSSTNIYIGSQKNVQKKLDCSITTVNRTFQKLCDNNCLTKVQNGVYAVNPDLLMKGSDRKRALMIEYHNELKNDTLESNKKELENE